jgi:hypothetical protein
MQEAPLKFRNSHRLLCFPPHSASAPSRSLDLSRGSQPWRSQGHSRSDPDANATTFSRLFSPLLLSSRFSCRRQLPRRRWLWRTERTSRRWAGRRTGQLGRTGRSWSRRGKRAALIPLWRTSSRAASAPSTACCSGRSVREAKIPNLKIVKKPQLFFEILYF